MSTQMGIYFLLLGDFHCRFKCPFCGRFEELRGSFYEDGVVG